MRVADTRQACRIPALTPDTLRRPIDRPAKVPSPPRRDRGNVILACATPASARRRLRDSDLDALHARRHEAYALGATARPKDLRIDKLFASRKWRRRTPYTRVRLPRRTRVRPASSTRPDGVGPPRRLSGPRRQGHRPEHRAGPVHAGARTPSGKNADEIVASPPARPAVASRARSAGRSGLQSPAPRESRPVESATARLSPGSGGECCGERSATSRATRAQVLAAPTASDLGRTATAPCSAATEAGR